MRYQVPQFIEIEDKILGPLTFKQFIYLAGGLGLSAVLFRFIPSNVMALIVASPIVLLSLALAFYKVHNRPFILVLEAGVKYFFSRKLYIWKRRAHTKKSGVEDSGVKETPYLPKLSGSKLKDLTWALDIKESENPVTRPEPVKVPLSTTNSDKPYLNS
jgi:hypothetical protein